MIGRLARWLERRVGGSDFLRDKLSKVFPESWTFLFGEIALYAFVVLVLTGTFLALFFDASHTETTYFGNYSPLHDVEMSAAYRSTLELSFDVPAGLLMRQAHHWAALVFVAAIVVHLSRIFFTGAYRRPRELNWTIGVTLLLLAILEGFAGYSLPDDLLSGTGARIAYAIIESIPFIGVWLGSLLFGGLFPGEEIIGRLFTLHVFILPVLFFGLIGLHLALVFRQTHTQFPGPDRSEDNVVGVKVWPTYTAMSVGMFMFTCALLFGLGGLVQINPVWYYGPYDPFVVSINAQPDWYMGWLEGSLRLFPPWEFSGARFMVANPFFPAALLPMLTFAALYAFPFLERRLTGDRGEHHVLDRARDHPLRSAVGAATITFYAILTIAGADDIVALLFNVDITGLVVFLRVAAVVGPVLAAYVTYRWCRDLAAGTAEAASAGTHGEAAKDEGGDGEQGPGQRWSPRRRWRLAFAGLAAALGYGSARRDRPPDGRS
ncbi:MAG TPA: cytochrome bc complex cytochrome b subunit [Nitriliruptorales bacterium]|nr:cytochrome bc complex cytochrome b subunit [Nitriliruptorales bacterium]